MQYLDQPFFKKEGNVFVLYKLSFSTDPGSTSVVASGAGMEVGRFSTEQELQEKSFKLFKQKARRGE